MAQSKPSSQPARPPAKTSSRPDLASVGGLLVALVGILGGMMLEGGKLKEVLQPTAAMIVFGGTFGAVMLTMPLHALQGAAKRLVSVFLDKQDRPEAAMEEIIGYATKARKSGIVSLEQEADSVQDRFLRKALGLAVDGADLQELRKIMDLEISIEEQRAEAEAKVFEAAGGYSPTIGIIGAVLGLIQVMKNLANIDEVGRGIATAFVATIYGVGAANVLFLPAANKLRARAQAASQLRELVLEGVVGIVEGLNPKLIRTKLEAFVPPVAQPRNKKKEPPAAQPGSKAAAA